MVFMKPTAESAARLADPKAVFNMHTALQHPEFLAVIDLSQSKEEAADEKVTATKSGTFEGFEFTPAKWAAIRQVREQDFAEQARLARFIDKVVMAGRPTLADVRAYLGPPDSYYRNDDGLFYEYRLNLETYNHPRVGEVSGNLNIRFGDDLQVRGYSFDYRKYVRVSETSQEVRELTAEERQALGL
jgi:hypothetical protein